MRKIRYRRGKDGMRKFKLPWRVTDFDVLEVPSDVPIDEALAAWRPDMFGPDSEVLYRAIRVSDHGPSLEGGVDPDEEQTWVHDCVNRHGLAIDETTTAAILTGYYSFLFHVGLLRNDWGYGFPKQCPLLSGSNEPMPAEWVDMPRDGAGPLWGQLKRLCRDGVRVFERRWVGGEPIYERLFVDDDGLAAWIRGDLPWTEPEQVLGVYRLGSSALDVSTFGEPVPFPEEIGLEHVPWIIHHWNEVSEADPPTPEAVAAVLEAQYRFMCAQGIAIGDKDGWEACTPDELEAAMQEYGFAGG